MITLVAVVAVMLGVSCGVSMGGEIFSVDHNNLPAVGGSAAPWGDFNAKSGSPTVVELGGEKWMENHRATSDRLVHNSGGAWYYSNPNQWRNHRDGDQTHTARQRQSVDLDCGYFLRSVVHRGSQRNRADQSQDQRRQRSQPRLD